MSAFDCLVMPSKCEGFGIVAVEAQAAGLPCYLSEKVPAIVNVSGRARILPIDNGVDSWKEAVLNADFDIDRRRARSSSFQGGVYDIRNSNKIISEVISEGMAS